MKIRLLLNKIVIYAIFSLVFTKKNLLNNLPLLLIILAAFLIRFIWIDKVPNAVGGDELTYVVNARAMVLTGSDVSGTWNPLTGFIFNYPAYTLPQAELPYFLLAPFVGFMGFTFFSVRIIFVLLSVLSVPLIYLITRTIFNKNAGLAAAFVMAFNPWAVYMGRTAYESTPAIFFFLLSFYMLLILKGRNILFTIPILFFAFYSYVATKVSFLPFVAIILLFSYFFVNKKKYLKEYLIVFVSCFALVLVFAFAAFTTSGQSRAGELININAPQIASEVDYIRKTSIQSPLTSLFENKVTIFSRIVLEKLFNSFSINYLFITGDQFYSLLRHGLFYVLDALFLLLGFVYVYAKRKSSFLLLFSLVLVGVLPQLVHSNSTDNFSIHLSLSLAVFPIIIGIGIWETIKLIKNKWYFRFSTLTIGVAYLFLILNFVNIYFYQFPLRGYFDFHVRLLSKYSALASAEGKEVTIYSPSAPDIFKKYIFYTNSYNKDTYLAVRKNYKSENFKFQNINFLGCDRTIDVNKNKNLIIYDFNCGSLVDETKHLAIPRLLDGGQSYQIYNDTTCSKFNLKRYPEGLKIDDFAIESLSTQRFCETFITSL
jgi:4-amino-4-deoxy-L-arabinose transferase-like glycosyltransferase